MAEFDADELLEVIGLPSENIDMPDDLPSDFEERANAQFKLLPPRSSRYTNPPRDVTRGWFLNPPTRLTYTDIITQAERERTRAENWDGDVGPPRSTINKLEGFCITGEFNFTLDDTGDGGNGLNGEDDMKPKLQKFTPTGMPNGVRVMTSAVVGLTATVIGTVVFSMPGPNIFIDLLMAVGSSALIGIGTYNTLPALESFEDKIVDNLPTDGSLSPANVRRIINGAIEKLEKLRASTRKISDEEIKAECHAVNKIAERIILGFKDDPSDIQRSTNFLNSLLDQTVTIVGKFADVEERLKTHPKKKRDAIVTQFRTTINALESAFNEQYTRNLQDEVTSLDVDLEVLERTLESSGLNNGEIDHE